MHDDDARGNTTGRRRRSRLRRPSLLAAATAAALLAAGCSSGAADSNAASQSSAPASSARASGLAFSQCMRAHGIKNFPDPTPSGGIAISASSGINPDSPQYQAAQKTCQPLASSGKSPAQQQHDYASALRYAHCMQTHGVPGFPEPMAPGSGPSSQSHSGGGNGNGASGGVNPNSPQFIAASKTCQHYLPAGQGPGTSTSTGGGS